MLEIRWHGRGGQGTKSASHLLAKIFFELGFFSQGFPFFGAEIGWIEIEYEITKGFLPQTV